MCESDGHGKLCVSWMKPHISEKGGKKRLPGRKMPWMTSLFSNLQTVFLTFWGFFFLKKKQTKKDLPLWMSSLQEPNMVIRCCIVFFLFISFWQCFATLQDICTSHFMTPMRLKRVDVDSLNRDAWMFIFCSCSIERKQLRGCEHGLGWFLAEEPDKGFFFLFFFSRWKDAERFVSEPSEKTQCMSQTLVRPFCHL